MSTLVALVEEPSAAFFLKAVMPSVLPEGVTLQTIAFQGKQDLERGLERKLKGWLRPDSRFLVMRDRDSEDCIAVKKRLEKICKATGRKGVLIRIACGELESFFLGDLHAVGIAFGKKMPTQNKGKFRDPDRLGNAAEELGKLLGTAEQKLKWSRMISPHLALDGSNRSHSFNTLITGVRKMFSTYVADPTRCDG